MANKQMRYSDQELDLIKRTFADNEVLLRAVRKVMLQMPLNAVDLSMLLVFKKEDIMSLMSKTFLPQLDGDAPIGQEIDLWMTVSLENKNPEEAYPHIIARDILIRYIEQQLNCLKDTNAEVEIKFKDFIDVENDEFDVYANLIARNTMISHTEQQINMLNILAGMKSETVEETKERLSKDSNK